MKKNISYEHREYEAVLKEQHFNTITVVMPASKILTLILVIQYGIQLYTSKNSTL